MLVSHSFFNRPADVVARELLGMQLCVACRDGIKKLPLTETEAYLGPHDLACHSARGRTPRTEPMFGPPGTLYIYLIYGMYEMLNIVTGEKDYPAAVLIRGAGTYNGPGKLTKALGINRRSNGMPLGKESGIWIERNRSSIAVPYIRTPRIGVQYAGLWAEKKLRFVAKTLT